MNCRGKCGLVKVDEYLAPEVRDIARIKDAYERVRNTWEKMISI